MLNVVNLRFFHLIGGKCINVRKLEPFGEICTSPPGQLARWTCFSKITNKKLSLKIKRKNIKKKKSLKLQDVTVTATIAV